MSFKRHSDATLMGMTKAELVGYVRMCEHNREVAEQTLAQHIENVKDWKPVRHGHWVTIDTPLGQCCVCSVCGSCPTMEYRFCPYCGNPMDGGADNGE